MRRRVLLALVIGGSGVAVPLAAAGGTTTAHITLPAPNSAQMTEIDVTASGTGAVTAHTVNDKALGNLAVLYIVSGPSKPHAGATYKVYVLVRRFFARTVASAAGQDIVVDISAIEKIRQQIKISVCSKFDELDKGFESGSTVHTANGTTDTLSSGRSQTAQPSRPESVLDDLVVSLAAKAGCPGKTEGYDPGNR